MLKLDSNSPPLEAFTNNHKESVACKYNKPEKEDKAKKLGRSGDARIGKTDRRLGVLEAIFDRKRAWVEQLSDRLGKEKEIKFDEGMLQLVKSRFTRHLQLLPGES